MSNEQQSMKPQRILMAMSGGVDSSVAAALLQEAGHELIGVTVRGWTPPGWEDLYGDKACCSLSAVEDARAVANNLGIPFYVLNFADAFYSEVVSPFVTGYLEGRTPNPCVLCNKRIRFDLLYRKARELECDAVATGHFARVKYEDGRYRLLRGVDRGKDQSYMLYSAEQRELAMTVYPLGGMTKAEVRHEAAYRRLPTAERPESQDICFVPDGDYARLIGELYPEAMRPGPILYRDGHCIGKHQGLYRHTVGQRRGLGLVWSEPLYVLALDPKQNALIVGEQRYIWSTELIAGELNWIAFAALGQTLEAMVKIRYSATPSAARIEPLPHGRCRVVFVEPQRAPAPGQAVVFYRGEEVLGGGTIQ